MVTRLYGLQLWPMPKSWQNSYVALKDPMRIGFLYPAWTRAYGIFAYFAKRNSSWPPMNLALLGAIVQSHGHEAFIVDGTSENLEVDELVARTLAQNPDIIGLTSYSPFFHVQVELAKALKKAKPDLPIMIRGSHRTIVTEKAILDDFDYVFAGEAESALPEFLGRLENGEALDGLKGLIRRDGNGAVYSSGGALPLQDFNGILKRNRELIDNQFYLLHTVNGRVRSR
jgi:anaerobic magnesium-protoporphyrin IX monomethyl ester cyclase